MKKLKFTLQVFAALTALPVVTIMELRHDSGRPLAGKEITNQQMERQVRHNQSNEAGKSTVELQGKNFTRQYVK